jgi:hypothetical protein
VYVFGLPTFSVYKQLSTPACLSHDRGVVEDVSFVGFFSGTELDEGVMSYTRRSQNEVYHPH